MRPCPGALARCAENGCRRSSNIVRTLHFVQKPCKCKMRLQIKGSLLPATTAWRYLRQSRAEYQSNTRKARSVIHRLGRPTPSSISTGILPGYWVSSSHRPSPPRFDSTRSIASAARSSGATPALGAGTRAPAARRSATRSGRRSGSTRRRPCDLARSPRRSTAGGRGGARGGTPARGDGPRSPPGCSRGPVRTRARPPARRWWC